MEVTGTLVDLRRLEEAAASFTPDGKSTTWLIEGYLNNVDEWKDVLKSYLNDETEDLTSDQWGALRESFAKFHKDVVAKCGQDVSDGFPLSPEDYAEKASDAIRFLKKTKYRLQDVVDELCYDDPEVEARRVLLRIVDNAVLLAEGGKPFERIDVEWVDPLDDLDFHEELYNFSCADRELPDADPVPWLAPAGDEVSTRLPRDLLARLSTPMKCGDVDDHDDWEYSVTHPPSEEEEYARFEPTFDILRKGLKDILIEEIQNDSSNANTTASMDPDVVAVAAKRLESGEIDVDFKPMFILPFEANHSKLVGVRDESLGDLISYKEVLKPPFERIVDKNLRKDPKAWLDPERPAGPQIRTYGWEPLSEVGEDEPVEESTVVKKKENPDAFGAGSAVTESDVTRMEELVRSLKKEINRRIEHRDYGTEAGAPDVKCYLDLAGEKFGIIPETFGTPQEFLKTLDLPKMREIDSKIPYPLDTEVIPLDPEWVGLDGSGSPHEPLVEEKYWKSLESFKKPPSTQLVDWKAMLSQELEGSDDPEDQELMKYLEEVAEVQNKKKQDEKPVEISHKGVKEHPAKKRQLDKEFMEKWAEQYGSTDGIQGFDPKDFKAPEHLVSLDEYNKKFLTHPFTSSYVFHPNFVRFRRMTKDHPMYSEYTWKKLDSPDKFDPAANSERFKSLFKELETRGAQTSGGDSVQINEKNLGLDAEDAKKWDSEFAACMTEKLSLLESFAERSRSEFKKPDHPCKEEDSKDLLFTRLEKPEIREDFSKEFLLQPFTTEGFSNLPQTTDAPREKPVTPAVDTSGSDDSDSDDDDDDGKADAVPPRTVQWRPIKEFKGYEKLNVLQMLSDASCLVETTVSKRFHPPPRIMEWIQGKYQPSTNRLKKWRKQYSRLFPDTDSMLTTPLLFMSEEERLCKLNQFKSDGHEETNPWALTKEEKTMLQNTAGQADDAEEDLKETDGDSKTLENLEERAGIGKSTQLKIDAWAEEVDITEAPDMTTIGEPALAFPFELDNFQKQAILALENGYNVFVSAHTSAGKTAVAEYAIAMSRKRKSRAIYTSPIKALSNQKYNDFKLVFDSVGLITGDVQLNETADCLIMTTEILRSMLYNSSEGIRDLEFVVLDEVHYLNDPERGHVWEEVLILLPENVQIVMLSATVPNYMDFASWVGRNKKRKVMVCKTLSRPVPLKHYFYIDLSKIKNTTPSSGLFLLKDGDKEICKSEWPEIHQLIRHVDMLDKSERKKFRQRQHDKAREERRRQSRSVQTTETITLSEMEQQENASADSGPNKQELMSFYKKKEKKHWNYFMKYLQGDGLMPAIVFAFSRKKCDELADLLDSPELPDMTSEPDKRYIRGFIESQMRKLDDEDRDLPQIKMLSKHLQKGIGVHHSGILPVLKEIVEILFREGRIKLLIATETFAMGVNMPARTVVFYSICKFDGNAQRYLQTAEYTQMAGRAGRRGEDTVGNVIIKCPSRDAVKLEIGDIEKMMTGDPNSMESQFRMAYRMLLNTLTKGSKITAVDMMQLSFHENKDQQDLMKRKAVFDAIAQKEEELGKSLRHSYPQEVIERYSNLYAVTEQYLQMWSDLRGSQSKDPRWDRDVATGKFVKFNCGQVTEKVGLIVTTRMYTPREYTVLALQDQDGLLEKPKEIWEPTQASRWFKMLAVLDPKKSNKGINIEPSLGLSVYQNLTPVDIVEVYKETFNLTEDRGATLIRLARLATNGGRKKSDPDLDAICYKLSQPLKSADLPVPDVELYEMLKSMQKEIQRLMKEVYGTDNRTTFIEKFSQMFVWKEVEAKKFDLNVVISEKTMGLYPEYCGKMEVLKKLKYIVDDRVQMKGYMAARINKYELVMTEMLVRNVLKDLTPEEVAALMSFIVYQTRGVKEEKDEIPDDFGPTEKLTEAIKDTIGIIQELQHEEQIRGVASEELVGLTSSFGLVHIMYRWAKQDSFAKVMQYTVDFQEGMLVRWIQQLVEALKEIESAARVMGNNDLPKKIQDAIKTIKRGIVFSPSLYTTL